ncbi:hypothetical protein D3C77_451970 [compost metagenome]
MATRKSRPVRLSRGATEKLLELLHAALPNPNNPSEMKGRGVRERNRIEEVHHFIWNAWADTHPEEGPFK